MESLPNLLPITAPRSIDRLVSGQATSDGAGVKLTRGLTQDLPRRLDPFLMLDIFGSDKAGNYIAGFPDHPHRSFETVTYMLAGRMRHRDSAGNEGLLQSGGVQWMTAGRGVIHSELPEQAEGLMEGFQLWLNLPAKDKMCAPWYCDLQSAEVPEWAGESVSARVIAGASHGVKRAVQREGTAPRYLDIHLDPGASFEQAVPRQRMAILANEGDSARLTASSQGARALLIAGRPLNESIAQYGPFVMNTQQEIRQAVEDFRAGRLA